MANIIIYGGGGLALEVLSYIKDIEAQAHSADKLLGVFVPEAFSIRSDDILRIAPACQIFRTLSDIDPSTTQFVIGIGDPTTRYRLHRELQAQGFSLYTLIHPTAVVCSGAESKAGAVIAPFAFVGPYANIGESALLNTYASVGHDANVGAGSTLSPYACLNGNAVTGRACFMGSHAALSPGAKMGDGCKVSAGSIFSRQAESGSMIHGNPAKSRVMMRVNLD